MNHHHTMQRARIAFAGRETVAPAVYRSEPSYFGETRKVCEAPRERARHPAAASFRSWARQHLAKMPAEALSPKLARIVHGC